MAAIPTAPELLSSIFLLLWHPVPKITRPYREPTLPARRLLSRFQRPVRPSPLPSQPLTGSQGPRITCNQEAVEAARRDAKGRGRTSKGAAVTPGQLHSVKCDVSKEEDILAAFKWVKENTAGVHVLVNNAGVAGDTKLTDTNTAEWKRILDVNVLGLSVCTREAVQQMKANGVDDGHIVHISSVAGHVNPSMSEWSMYFASKHAVRVLTEGLRKELVASKSKIRVTEVSPGLVATDIFDALPSIEKNLILQAPHLESEDVSDAVLYAIGCPPHVQIHEIMLKPTCDPF